MTDSALTIFVSRFPIFSAEANPFHDSPRCYASLSTIARKLAAGAIREAKPNVFQEVSLNHRSLDRFNAESGYDIAMRTGKASEMMQVWSPRDSFRVKVWQMDGSRIRPMTAFQRRNPQETPEVLSE